MEPAIPAGRTRETRIRRDALGRWFDGEDPIAHPQLVRAFDGWIELGPDGRYCLKNDINWAYVRIEGAPIFVRRALLEGDQARLLLSDGREERLDAASLRQGPDGTLYCQARGGTMPAQFDREAMQGLAEALGEDDDGVYLSLAGRRVRPPMVENPLTPVET